MSSSRTPLSKPRHRRAKTTEITDPVEVFCRVRPLANPNDAVCLKILSPSCVELIPNNEAITEENQTVYSFSHVYDTFTSQSTIFEEVALPLVQDLLHGKNGLLFTYGVTSSGKTYTMMGSSTEPGILPRCVDVIFNSIADLQAKKYVFVPDKMNAYDPQSEAEAMRERHERDILPGIVATPNTRAKIRQTANDKLRSEFLSSGRSRDENVISDIPQYHCYAVFVSYIEIYNNYVYDLLEEFPSINAAPQSKSLRADVQGNMYVSGATEVEIKSPEDAFQVVERGRLRRKVAHTLLNANSSRSHSVFNIRIVQAPMDNGDQVITGGMLISQLSLCDLAGSERADRTNNRGDRLREAGNINKSLMNLRTCIDVLRQNQKTGSNEMVPYRNYKLTHLFKNYFDGIGKVRMVVCCSSHIDEYDENTHVMQFAEATQEVEIARQPKAVTFAPALAAARGQTIAELYKQYSETVAVSAYVLGPALPPTLLHFSDQKPFLDTQEDLDQLYRALQKRQQEREKYIVEYDEKADLFRARLIEFCELNRQLNAEFQKQSVQLETKEEEIRRSKDRIRTLEKENATLRLAQSEAQRDNNYLLSEVTEKKHEVERARKNQAKLQAHMESELERNERKLHRQMIEEKRKLQAAVAGKIQTQEEKLSMMRHILNEDGTSSDERGTPASVGERRGPGIAPKPGRVKALIAKSECDIKSSGSDGSGTPNTRQTPHTRQTPRVASATVGRAVGRAYGTRGRNPVCNPRHRRSRSHGSNVLNHQAGTQMPLNTVMQPSLRKKRSVSGPLTKKQLKRSDQYILTEQQLDNRGDIQTTIHKGDILPTAGGGAAVIFKDVEKLQQYNPNDNTDAENTPETHTVSGSARKRRSAAAAVPIALPGDDDVEQWTDVETRCKMAIEGGPGGSATIKKFKPTYPR